MKNTTKIFLILSIVAVFACGLALWARNSPIVGDYYTIHDRDTEIDLAFAFATALRVNHPAAYDMTNPSLKPRIDEWMNTHQSHKCMHPADVFLISTGTNRGNMTVFGCYGYNGWISFEVDDIVIKDMKVIDWGDVKEE
jgi:hypothetical protein